MSSFTIHSSRKENAIERWAQPSAEYASRLENTLSQLKTAIEQLSPIKQASSLGPEDIVITHLLETLHASTPVFVLETGALNHETLALLERLQAHAKLPIEIYHPMSEEVMEFVKTKGQKAIYTSIEDRKACCQIRKLEPLSRALKGQRAWITGLRREQSSARAQVSFIDDSELSTKGYTKVNPLVDWTWGDVWHHIRLNQLDYNPLHDDFFPSIGCAPCTRAISMGEEFRAGRWWWEDESAKECGLHVTQAQTT
jgi:phosphoadenosine phosphosulfate reductase